MRLTLTMMCTSASGRMAMSLDEAIAHCKEVAQRLKASCDAEDYVCGDEHLQLASWLEELKTLRAQAKQ